MTTAAITTSTTPTTPTADTVARIRVSWRSGLTTGVVAAAVTTALAGAFAAAGSPLEVQGEAIPVFAFAQMVLLGSVIGIVVARHSRRTTFVRATVVLTAASCIPSLALGTGVFSKLALVLTHVVAATIVIPRLARPLSE
jgi:hypothetical protein